MENSICTTQSYRQTCDTNCHEFQQLKKGSSFKLKPLYNYILCNVLQHSFVIKRSLLQRTDGTEHRDTYDSLITTECVQAIPYCTLYNVHASAKGHPSLVGLSIDRPIFIYIYLLCLLLGIDKVDNLFRCSSEQLYLTSRICRKSLFSRQLAGFPKY